MSAGKPLKVASLADLKLVKQEIAAQALAKSQQEKAQALQAQRDALGMQAAVSLAQDLWERMQLFPQASMYYQLQLGQVTPKTDCTSQACTPSQWAQSDLSAWQAAVPLRLPGAQTQLVTNAPAKVQLLFAWPDNSTQNLGATMPSACPSRHRCWQTSWSL